MDKNLYDILIISSKPPTHSAGLGKNCIEMYETAGLNVDYMTVYDYSNKDKNVITLLPGPQQLPPSTIRKYFILPVRRFLITTGLYTAVEYVKDRICKMRMSQNKSGLLFLYPDERKPPIPVDLITRNITKRYDAVITVFWEGMLNSTSLVAIYEKLKCPIIISSPDMAPMTGGCYYFGKCRNFHTGCGNCPALNSNDLNDQSKANYQTKKANYSRINCAFLGNTWMLKYAKDSKLFKSLFHSEIIINPNEFKPSNMNEARLKLGIEDRNQFIILVASNVQPRKGNKDIAYAIDKIIRESSSDDLKHIELLIIGDDYFSSLLKNKEIKTTELGFVDLHKLICCYQASNVFISASNDDAGPSMINQSIMCGTPVISYDNGTAIDVIENNISGFKSEIGDKDGLAEGIKLVLNMPLDEYRTLRETTRAMAMQHNSPEVGVKNHFFAIKSMLGK